MTTSLAIESKCDDALIIGQMNGLANENLIRRREHGFNASLDKTFSARQTARMAFGPESPLDSLWTEYGRVFQSWDDLTLARWLAQTLGQFEGRAWRLSHPLVGAYRLGAQVGHSRQIWFKRLATAPAAYVQSACCRAPFLPLLTRDAQSEGLICQHCDEVLLASADFPSELSALIAPWAKNYEPVHAVAHWDDRQRKQSGNYDAAFEVAAQEAEKLLVYAGQHIAPKLLDTYATIIWEDQDECLEVRPEDVRF